MMKTWLRYSGLVAPLVAWALSTQLGQITPYLDCRNGFPWTAAFWGVLFIVSVASVAASRVVSSTSTRTERFVADTSLLIALAIIFAMSLQGVASMLLDPCQR
jgi:hypothetical protein